jgi:thymidine phosphorylase
MSKKIASGADIILIDIKVGKGALIRTKKDAKFITIPFMLSFS